MQRRTRITILGEVHTSDMNRRWLLAVATLALTVAALVVWRAWARDPGSVAPPVTAQELSRFDRAQQGSLTLLDGGSTSQAHRLWDYYHDRPAYQGVKPRLLGISRVQLRGSPADDGVYWLVFSDHVYQASFGAGGGGGYGREVVLVPDGSTSVKGNITTY
jgi:hypothetical protein